VSGSGGGGLRKLVLARELRDKVVDGARHDTDRADGGIYGCARAGELETHLRRTPPSDLRGRSATFTLTSASAKWGYEVQLDDEPGWTLGPAFVADATTGAVTGLVSAHRVLSHTMNCVSPGPHTLRVRTFDAAGVRAQPASAEWTQHAPMATLAVGMPPRVNPGADHWVEVRSDGAKYAFELRVDDGDWVLGDAYAPAAAKKAAAAAAAVGGVGGRSSGAGGAEMGLSKFTESPRMERQRVRAGAEGRHALEVRALDECGNRGEPVRSEWVSSWVSTVVVEAAPDGEALFADSASFAAKGDTPHYFVEHSLDDGAWVRSRKMSSAATAAPVRVQLAGLSEGRHTLVVRALDAQGRAAHVSQQARFAWAVDRQPPVTRVGDGGARRERDVGLGMAAEAMVTVVPYDVTDATECTVEYQLGRCAQNPPTTRFPTRMHAPIVAPERQLAAMVSSESGAWRLTSSPMRVFMFLWLVFQLGADGVEGCDGHVGSAGAAQPTGRRAHAAAARHGRSGQRGARAAGGSSGGGLCPSHHLAGVGAGSLHGAATRALLARGVGAWLAPGVQRGRRSISAHQ
jgi:hypothetical protein